MTPDQAMFYLGLFTGAAATLSVQAIRRVFNDNQAPDGGWRCTRCEMAVPSEAVTHDETHDPRCGGCGGDCV